MELDLSAQKMPTPFFFPVRTVQFFIGKKTACACLAESLPLDYVRATNFVNAAGSQPETLMSTSESCL